MSGEFVDSNILIYAHDTSAGRKRRIAMALIERLMDHQVGLLSMQVLMEFHVNVTSKIAQPLSSQTSFEIIEDFSRWRPYSPNVEDALRAIRTAEEYRIHFWDAMIVQAAVRLDASIIWSEDLNHGQSYRGINLKNPFVEEG